MGSPGMSKAENKRSQTNNPCLPMWACEENREADTCFGKDSSELINKLKKKSLSLDRNVEILLS